MQIGSFRSLQPVSSRKFSSEGSIALFAKANFASHANTISAEESKASGIKQLTESLPTIGSIITVGKGKWSLISSTGATVCVRPQPSENTEMPICYGLDLLKNQIEGFHIDAAYPGCSEKHDISLLANMKLKDCVDYGRGTLLPLKTSGTIELKTR